MLPSQQKCQTDSAALRHIHTQRHKNFFFFLRVSSVKFFTERKKLSFYAAKALVVCVSYEMSNIVQQCQISSPVVTVVGSWLFVGLGSL